MTNEPSYKTGKDADPPIVVSNQDRSFFDEKMLKYTNGPIMYLGAKVVDGRLYATVMQHDSNDKIVTVATAEIDVNSLMESDCCITMMEPPRKN